MSDELRYPIGRYDATIDPTPDRIAGWVNDIAVLPELLRETVHGLDADQLDTPYRPGGWTVRQVVHHIGDSHLNSIIRFKWGLTENRPRIKTYDEEAWAELVDYTAFPVEEALDFVEILHARWVSLLRNLTDEQWAQEIDHPGWGVVPLARVVAIYSWHGKHHCAHISHLRARNSW